MSKLLVSNDLGSKSSQKTIKSKDSLLSKRSRCSGSLMSVHGSRFGRCVSKLPKQNDPGLVQSLSTTNSRIIRTIFNIPVRPDSKLPDLTQFEATDCIRVLGISLRILDYEFNYASFWILDTLSNFLKYLQLHHFSLANQITALAWFRFVLRCISVTGAPREEVFELLQEMFKTAYEIVQEGKPIPQPEEIKIEGESSISSKLSQQLSSLRPSKSLSGSDTSKSGRRRPSHISKAKSISKGSGRLSSRTLSRKSSTASTNSKSSEDKLQNNLNVLYTITEWLYKMFADRFVFSLVSLAFSSPSMMTPVDLQVDFQELKRPRPEPLALPLLKSKPQSPSKGKGAEKKKGRKSRASSKLSKGTSLDITTKPKGKGQKEKKKGRKSRASSKLSKGTSLDVTNKPKGKGQKEKKKDRKSRASSRLSKGLSVDDTNETKEKGPKEKKKDKKGTKENEGAPKKGKGEGGKSGKKSKSEIKGDEKESKSVKGMEETTKNKKGKGKGKRKSSSIPESKRYSRKGKKSTLSSLTANEEELKKAALEAKIKLFDRNYSSNEEKMEQEKIRTKDLYILPLSEAVNEHFVGNLLDAMFPQEKKPAEKPKEDNEKIKTKKMSRQSSVKSGKKKQKGKKKK